MTKLVILGNGQLGSYLYKNWKLNGYEVDVIDYPEFDITDQKMVEDVVSKYDVIINAAAYTLVDKAESEKLRCFSINSIGPIMLADACLRKNKKLIHISTESVFGSNDPKYTTLKEWNRSWTPTNSYAISKALADYFILNENSNNFLILRPGWLFGPDNDHNFVEKIRRLVLSRDKIQVVDDQIGTMTYVGLILEAVEMFLQSKMPAGIYHIGNTGYPSRYEVACFIKDCLNANCIIERCSSEEFKRAADVAKNSCLDCNNIKIYGGSSVHWKDDVKKVLNVK